MTELEKYQTLYFKSKEMIKILETEIIELKKNNKVSRLCFIARPAPPQLRGVEEGHEVKTNV